MEIYVNPDRSIWAALTSRRRQDDSSVTGTVAAIVERVRKEGDDALYGLAAEIDKVQLESLQVSAGEIEAASALVAPGLKESIALAAANIEAFHKAQYPQEKVVQTSPGVKCVSRPVPIQNVGLYIPGGSAPLFSTVLMLSIPARVAGCARIVMCTPPDAKGQVNPVVLYAASLCGVDKIYKVGGAQAVAAMAYGTQTIPKVDKIFGPGNRYVTMAKQALSNVVAIDMPAGPSEVMVMADSSARADFVASDLLSQAEHGPDSQAMLVCSSEKFAREALSCTESQLAELPRRDIAARALEGSRVVVFDSEDDMVDFANLYAAEHLIISMRNPWQVAGRITAAGSIFIGNYSTESAGDYASGTNHTLPTSGWARSFSGVNTESFMRRMTLQELSVEGLRNIGPAIMTMASGEGLEGHRRAVEIRLDAAGGKDMVK